jgi:hypothetical protein
MKRSLSIESARQRVCHPATLVTPSSADQAFVDNRESTTIQRQLMGIMANSPQANAQRLINQQVHDSSRMLAQRKMISDISEGPLQRIDGKQFTHENIVQRVLSPLPGKSSGVLKGKRDKINTLIAKYNKAETKPNSKDERNKLLDDITILTLNWERSVIKKKTKAEKSFQTEETKHLKQKLAEIEAFRIQVDNEFEMLNGKIEAKLEKTDSEVKVPTVETAIKEKSSSLEERHQSEITHLLRTAGYSEIQPPYMMKSYKTELPHVGWKAHIGATQETAVSVLKKVIPVFNELMVPNKVDWTLAVFGKTNKFITIYPPKDEGIWQSLIQALEGEVGHQMVHVEGELPVGKMGRVGMRHGQLSALTRGILDKNDIKYEDLSLKSIQLTDKNQYDITIKNGVMMIENGGAFFGEHTEFKQRFPGMVYNGKVCLDPRQQPNPYNEPLPKGVIIPS